MSVRYMFAEKRKILAHPFHVKSTWQPPIQNSVAPERYLEETKLELASTVFHAPLDNISANESKAIGSLKRNSKINLKKADKETTTVIMNTVQKIEEGLEQLPDDKFYKLLTNPIVLDTAQKVNRIVNKLFRSGNIDTMIHKWLTIGNHPRIPEFYTLTKIHKKIPVARLIVTGSIVANLLSASLVSLTHYFDLSHRNRSHILKTPPISSTLLKTSKSPPTMWV